MRKCTGLYLEQITNRAKEIEKFAPGGQLFPRGRSKFGRDWNPSSVPISATEGVPVGLFPAAVQIDPVGPGAGVGPRGRAVPLPGAHLINLRFGQKIYRPIYSTIIADKCYPKTTEKIILKYLLAMYIS
jgi:hypothetical protein